MDIKSINEWQNSLLEYLSSINKVLLENESSKEKYYGFEIIDGKLINNPEILFIGINPGSGSGERHFEIKFSTENISYLDVFNEGYKYSLAEETIAFFKLIGFNEKEIIQKFENDCVKTNLFHIITRNQNDIKSTFDNTTITYKSYYEKSVFYCIELIKLIKPKIVIFEGKSVYQTIVEDCFEIYDTWNKELNIGFFYWENESTHFIGYARTFSNINAKENLVIKLKEILYNM